MDVESYALAKKYCDEHGGISIEVKNALLDCFNNIAWTSDNSYQLIIALSTALGISQTYYLTEYSSYSGYWDKDSKTIQYYEDAKHTENISVTPGSNISVCTDAAQVLAFLDSEGNCLDVFKYSNPAKGTPILSHTTVPNNASFISINFFPASIDRAYWRLDF